MRQLIGVQVPAGTKPCEGVLVAGPGPGSVSYLPAGG